MKSATTTHSPVSHRLQSLNNGIDQALIWVDDTRLQVPRLALEAQTLMLNLRRCRIRLNRLAAATVKDGALAFYGRSQAAKTYLITALASAEPGYLTTTFAGKTLDFLTHIQSSYTSAGVAIRFSHHAPQQNSDYPVQLTLLTEAELVQMLARAGNTPYPAEQSQIADVLSELAKHRQPQAVAGISTDHIVAIWDALRANDNPLQQRWESEYWPNAVAIAPYLDIDGRASLFSLLWGGEPTLTECYRRLAYRLQQLGGTNRVMAPLSVLTDENQCPANNILALTGRNGLDDKVQVMPQGNGSSLVALTLAELNLLTAELLIPLSAPSAHSGFTHTDFLDLPACDIDSENLPPSTRQLQQAKSVYLLQRYSEQQEIHTLIVCHAAASREEAATVGRALESWTQQYQRENSRGHPRLIWAFTPCDQRATTQYDEAVQRYIGGPGEIWGTLLAMDEDDIRRMVDYLATSVKNSARQHLLLQQFTQLEYDLQENQLGRWLKVVDSDKAQIAKATVKALQNNITMHGELLEHLLPDRHALQQLYLQQWQCIPQDHDPLAITLDLFDEHPVAVLPIDDSGVSFAHQVKQLWIAQLRNLADNSALLSLLAIESVTLATLADELITASLRLDIWQQLEKALAEADPTINRRENHVERQIACTLTVLGDFVAWLGFQSLPPAQRPESRINRGYKIFAKSTCAADSRLTQLPTEAVNNSAIYIYDWLVGLRFLIGENAGYGAAQALSEQQREQLNRITQSMR